MSNYFCLYCSFCSCELLLPKKLAEIFLWLEMPSSVWKQALVLWAFFFAHQDVACPTRETESPLRCFSVVCHHLSHQSNLRAQTFFPEHSSTSCRASDGPGKAMSAAERQLRQQLDERECCHAVSIQPLKEQDFFYIVVFLLILGGASPELLDEAGRVPCGAVAVCTMPSPQLLRLPLATLPAEYKSTNPSLLLYNMNHFILLLKYFAFLFF